MFHGLGWWWRPPRTQLAQGRLPVEPAWVPLPFLAPSLHVCTDYRLSLIHVRTTLCVSQCDTCSGPRSHNMPSTSQKAQHTHCLCQPPPKASANTNAKREVKILPFSARLKTD